MAGKGGEGQGKVSRCEEVLGVVRMMGQVLNDILVVETQWQRRALDCQGS